MHDVYREFFEDPLPARTTVVTGLVGGIKVEIDCVAVVPT
jgi:enamine deaminase RidA (YjgF/YER057c/UK114 family)